MIQLSQLNCGNQDTLSRRRHSIMGKTDIKVQCPYFILQLSFVTSANYFAVRMDSQLSELC